MVTTIVIIAGGLGRGARHRRRRARPHMGSEPLQQHGKNA